MNARNRDLLYLALDYIADTPIRKSLYPLWNLFFLKSATALIR